MDNLEKLKVEMIINEFAVLFGFDKEEKAKQTTITIDYTYDINKGLIKAYNYIELDQFDMALICIRDIAKNFLNFRLEIKDFKNGNYNKYVELWDNVSLLVTTYDEWYDKHYIPSLERFRSFPFIKSHSKETPHTWTFHHRCGNWDIHLVIPEFLGHVFRWIDWCNGGCVVRCKQGVLIK